jgi:hypothetical protein
MKTITAVSGAFVVLLFASALSAQEAPDTPAPQREHEWLRQFAGEWESEGEVPTGPGQPAMKCKGTINARMLGGFWVVSDIKTDMAGTQITALQTIGYDARTKKYVATWADSVLDHLWKCEGTVDATGKTLTLEAEGPSFMHPGKLTKFRDVYEFKSKDHIVTTSSCLGDDGKWITFMTGNTRRKK